MRQEAVAAQIQTWRSQLHVLLGQFSKIPDPRNPNKIKHQLTVILLYGLLAALYQMSSRRQINREMSRPAFWTALKGLFPELKSIPHADTLARLLERIDPIELETAHLKLLNRYIRNKKFNKYLISRCYPMAVDGTQKLVRNGDFWEQEWLKRNVGKKEDPQIQRYVYVLEANLVFHNGMSLPVMSEFLFYEADLEQDTEKEKQKQDCELKGFYRLAERLKSEFPRLSIMLILDGLYPNGPVIALCQQYNWQYMIVLQDKSLSTVWEEVEGLRALQTKNTYTRTWKGRQQEFYWVNHIAYEYQSDGMKTHPVHVVVCEEQWQEIDKDTGEIINKKSRHAWVSSEPITQKNVHERCNLGARYRWGIEDSMNTEKNRGYHYEHPFSYDWKAMRSFHALMRIAHFLNALAQRTKKAKEFIGELGIKGYLALVKETFSGLWLSSEWMADLLKRPFQLRFE